MNLLNTFKWKIKELNEIKSVDPNHSTIREIIDKKYRYESFSRLKIIKESRVKEVLMNLGIKVTKDTPLLSMYEVFVEKIYDVDGYKAEPGMIIVDVGANYGDTALYWGINGAELHSFEPLKDVFSILEKNFYMNGIKGKTYNVALGNGSEIYGNRTGTMFTSGGKDRYKTDSLDRYNLSPHLLKIDVEGFEYEVLLGSAQTIKKFQPKIIIETHSKELRRKCDKFLKELGYKKSFEGKKTKGTGWMNEVTNLFYSVENV